MTVPAEPADSTAPTDSAVRTGSADSCSWIKKALPRDQFAPVGKPKYLQIYHPAYTDHNCLLALRAGDNGAVDYDTALMFCGIICVNSFTGWFSTTQDGLTRLPAGIPLQPGRVYFFATESTTGIVYFYYPIIFRPSLLIIK
jgi:hypothetical protein